MARAETLTKLPLDRWAYLMGLNPLHFNGLYIDEPTVCNQTWFQYSWQATDRVSREDVAIAIAQAEADLENYLGFRLLPTWEIDEWQPTARAFRASQINLPSQDVRGFNQTVKANWGYFIAGGQRAKTLIDADVAVAYSDADGDGWDELATVDVAVASGQQACEIRVYYPGHAGDDAWEIRPITVSITGLLATITFKRWQCLAEEHLVIINIPDDDSHHRGVDDEPEANDEFLETVDVYRVWNDPQSQAQLLWEPYAGSCSICDGSGCSNCAYQATAGCLMSRWEPRQSVLAYKSASWDADTETFGAPTGGFYNRQPDLVRLWYYSGWQKMDLPCPRVQMDPFWETVVARLAAAYLERPICECNNSRAYVMYWQADLALQNAEVSFKMANVDLKNPFGTTRGAGYAFGQINRTKWPIGRAAATV